MNKLITVLVLVSNFCLFSYAESVAEIVIIENHSQTVKASYGFVYGHSFQFHGPATKEQVVIDMNSGDSYDIIYTTFDPQTISTLKQPIRLNLGDNLMFEVLYISNGKDWVVRSIYDATKADKKFKLVITDQIDHNLSYGEMYLEEVESEYPQSDWIPEIIQLTGFRVHSGGSPP